MIEMGMGEQHGSHTPRRYRARLPIPMLKGTLLKQPGVDQERTPAKVQTILGAGYLAIRTEEMESHEGSSVKGVLKRCDMQATRFSVVARGRIVYPGQFWHPAAGL
jgi:hypothetical protein